MEDKEASKIYAKNQISAKKLGAGETVTRSSSHGASTGRGRKERAKDGLGESVNAQGRFTMEGVAMLVDQVL